MSRRGRHLLTPQVSGAGVSPTVSVGEARPAPDPRPCVAVGLGPQQFFLRPRVRLLPSRAPSERPWAGAPAEGFGTPLGPPTPASPGRPTTGPRPPVPSRRERNRGVTPRKGYASPRVRKRRQKPEKKAIEDPGRGGEIGKV